MPYNEQISTMLCENMQRRDLTILEEIDGIQLMLDLGETVESISEKTGLSKSTIYKRRNGREYLGKDGTFQKHNIQAAKHGGI